MKIKIVTLVAALGFAAMTPAVAQTAPTPPKPPTSTVKPDFPSYTTVLKGYEQVISSMEKKDSLFSIFVRKKDQQMLAALPAGFEAKRFFIATTVASGETYAGLQAGERYVYFKRLNKQLLIIEPNLAVRSTGDLESRASVKRLFTDRVLTSVPILTVMSKNRPVIDMDALLVGCASKFFGSKGAGFNSRLAQIKTAKAFPTNVELAFTAPTGYGVLKTLHYSISSITSSKTYKPRVADQRVGYFTTSYTTLASTRMSRRKSVIQSLAPREGGSKIEGQSCEKPYHFLHRAHNTGALRRWVREVLMWNKAFEKVGLQMPSRFIIRMPSPVRMEKDPEDARYNFVRWLNNDVGTAIGPSRVNPLTGQILDADIILTDGWIRHYWKQFNDVLRKSPWKDFPRRR